MDKNNFINKIKNINLIKVLFIVSSFTFIIPLILHLI